MIDDAHLNIFINNYFVTWYMQQIVEIYRKWQTKKKQIPDFTRSNTRENNHSAKTGWNIVLDHINSDVLSIFCDISNCPSKLCMIHFFDGLDQKNPTSYSGLEQFFPLSTASVRVWSEKQNHSKNGYEITIWKNIWNKGVIIEIWATQ